MNKITIEQFEKALKLVKKFEAKLPKYEESIRLIQAYSHQIYIDSENLTKTKVSDWLLQNKSTTPQIKKALSLIIDKYGEVYMEDLIGKHFRETPRIGIKSYHAFLEIETPYNNIQKVLKHE